MYKNLAEIQYMHTLFSNLKTQTDILKGVRQRTQTLHATLLLFWVLLETEYCMATHGKFNGD